jgi:hypothetical protein
MTAFSSMEESLSPTRHPASYLSKYLNIAVFAGA